MCLHLGRDSKMTSEELFIKRIQELANTADRKGCVVFTDFLNLNEQNILHQTLQKFSWIKGETFGGYEEAERQIAAFIPDALYYDWDYPIACIRIRPLNVKFAEELGHRDILGALIEASLGGDIGLYKSNGADIHVCHVLPVIFSVSKFLFLRLKCTFIYFHRQVFAEINFFGIVFHGVVNTVKNCISSAVLLGVFPYTFGNFGDDA